jgi:hypothetical protein
MTHRIKLHMASCDYCGNEMFARQDRCEAEEVRRVLRMLGWGYRDKRKACPTCMRRCLKAGIA